LCALSTSRHALPCFALLCIRSRSYHREAADSISTHQGNDKDLGKDWPGKTANWILFQRALQRRLHGRGLLVVFQHPCHSPSCLCKLRFAHGNFGTHIHAPLKRSIGLRGQHLHPRSVDHPATPCSFPDPALRLLSISFRTKGK
jgi:hypothetical protein